jgi:hypothetical protein
MSSSIPDPVPDDASPELLRRVLNYWRIEAITDQARWSDALVEIDLLKDKLEKVKAENERLRKAGDAMYLSLHRAASIKYEMLPKSCDAWTAAKGVQS